MSEDRIDYAGFEGMVTNYARHLRLRGVRRGSCVAVDSDHPVIATGLVLACSLLGCSWVHATTASLTNDVFPITHLVHDGVRTQEVRPGVFMADESWTRPPGTADFLPFEGAASDDDTWMIAQSSGTTGLPKFVPLDTRVSWTQATENFSVDLPDNPVFACLFPPLSKPGLFHVIRVLAKGGTCIFGEPDRWMDGMELDCVLGSPNHFTQFMDRTAAPAARMRLAAVAGAVARGPFFARMLGFFTSVNYFYAATEVAIMCSTLVTEPPDEEGGIGAGQPRPGVRIEIVDAEGNVLPAGHEGVVRVRTPWQVRGYLGNQALNASVFRDGWFHPGDFGLLDGAGNLFITGRVNDQLNIGGNKINPDLVDEIILSTDGVRDGACFAEPDARGIDRLVAAIVPARADGGKPTARAIQARIRDRLGPSLSPQAVYVLEALPRNANGKLIRHALVDTVRGKPGLGRPH